MSSHAADVLSAIREFVARIDQIDRGAPVAGELTVQFDGSTERLLLRAPVARALTEALRGFQDPRERGTCAHCAYGRLDDDFVCSSCGIVNGLFGETLAAFLSAGSPDPAPPEDRKLNGGAPGRQRNPTRSAITGTIHLDGTLGD